MARKFLTLDEAAEILGVTTETIGELRDRHEIHGYRDGVSWKFKQEDIEQLKADREAAEEEDDTAGLDEDPDSILLSEVELGQSGESTSSTIIGGKSSPQDPLEDDIQIARPKHDSDVLDDVLLETGSGGSDVLQAGSGVSPMFDELDNLDLEMPSAADSGISTEMPEVGSSPVLSESAGDSSPETSESEAGVGEALAAADSGISLAPSADTSDITLGSDALKLEGSGLSFGDDEELGLGEESSLELEGSQAGGSDIDLTGEVDDDLVLGGSSHGDLSRASDSGISLLDPADSGISLEAPPLELGGSGVEQLELGEDDVAVGDEEPAAGAPQSAAISGLETPQTEDDFLLTPLEEGGEEESDSGSQVIALEGDVEFEDAATATLEPDAGGPGLLEEDLGEGLGGVAALETAGAAPAAAPGTVAATVGAGAAAIAPEAPWTGWNVASLVMCSVLLMFCGMFMYDLMRNMWSWNSPYAVNSSMMDMVLSWFE